MINAFTIGVPPVELIFDPLTDIPIPTFGILLAAIAIALEFIPILPVAAIVVVRPTLY